MRARALGRERRDRGNVARGDRLQPPTTVRIGLVQSACTPDREANIAQAITGIAAAAKQGAHVVCLQELFAGEYPCQAEDHGKFAEAETVLAGLDRAVADPGNIDFSNYVRLNGKFHELLAEMPGSAVIRREIERVNRLPLASPTAFLREQDLVPDFMRSLIRAQGQHRAMLEAIANREGARAEGIAREHARLARNNFAFLTNSKPHLATRIPGLALVKAN